jgi:hypothetical protein
MVMEYGVLQHVRQSRIGSEGMLFDFAVSVLLQRGALVFMPITELNKIFMLTGKLFNRAVG